MAKDFDTDRIHRAERDRSFTIGGETFTYRASIPPEDLAEWNEAVSGEKELGERGWITLYDDTILRLLEPGQDEKWRAARSDETLPLNLGDMRGLMEWLLAEQSGRPTGQSSASTNGGGTTGTSSTEPSSSEQAPASAG
jgi:hypothetical protein